MKKYFIFIFVFFCTSLMTLVSCGSLSSYQGEFKNSEYVLSLGEEINFLEDFNCKGFTEKEIILSFSDESLLTFDEEKKLYIATQCGNGSVFASVNGQVIASAKIFIKNKFSKIKDISLSNEGQLSWPESYLVNSGNKITAKKYLLYLNNQQLTLSTNSYQIPNNEFGLYNVQIQALGDERTDSSEISDKQIFYYNIMQTPQNVKVQSSSEFANHEIEITWEDDNQDCFYKIKVNDILFEKELFEKKIILDCKNIAQGEILTIEIEACDLKGKNLSNKITFELSKLLTPEVKYKFEQNDGMLYFKAIEGASQYIAKVSSLISNQEFYFENSNFIELEQEIYTYVDGLDFDIYNISIQAFGEGFFLNSAPSESLTFVKLAKPEIEYKIAGNDLILSVSKDENVSSYKVIYGEKEVVWEPEINQNLILDISEFNKGKYSLKVFALPKHNGGEVDNIQIGDINSRNIVNSNAFTGEFYILEDIEYVEHQIINSNNIISFPYVEFADEYNLLINGTAFEGDYIIEQEQVKFVIENLARFSSNEGKYIFEISAKRKDEFSTQVFTNKTIKVLGIVGEKEEQTNGYFEWNKLSDVSEGDFEYFYQIFKTGKDYIINGEDPYLEKSTSFNITEKLDYGYYVIKIYSKSLNQNLYLDSDFENDIFYSQNFFVTEQVSKPEFEFASTNNNYSLSINTSEFATKYEIFVDGELDGFISGVSPEAEIINYKFQKSNFVDAKRYEISVIASVQSNLGDNILHPASSKSIIFVTRLSQPNFSVKVDFDEKGNKISEILSIPLIENADHAEIYYQENLISENGQVNLLSFPQSNFNFEMKYISKNNEGIEYYLDSIAKLNDFIRLKAPTNITYRNGVINFESLQHEKVEKYIAFITLVNENSQQNYTIRTEFHDKTFDLGTYIKNQIQEEDFASNYAQAISLKIKLYAYSNDGSFLPSNKGTTISGNDSLILEKLNSPILSFDNINMFLSWNSVGNNFSNTYYDIYIDEEIYRKDVNALSFSFANVEEDYFLQERKIFIVAKNESYLDSTMSNVINVRRLSSVDNVSISKENNEWILSFLVDEQDLDAIDQILVNGENVFVSGQSNIRMFLPLSSEEVNIEVVSKFSDSAYQFISSLSKRYLLEDLSNSNIEANIKNSILSWTAVAQDFIGVDENPLSYKISIFNGNRLIGVIENIKNTEIRLNDISILAGIDELESGEYSLEISSDIANYSLSNANNNAHGYFGYVKSDKIQLNKLESLKVTEISYENDINEVWGINQLLKAKKLLKWDNIWLNNQEECSFEVKVGEFVFENLSTLTKNDKIKLILVGNVYSLYLSSDLFGESDEITIVVHNSNAISSKGTTINCQRTKNPALYNVNNLNGMVTFVGKNELDYYLHYQIGDMVEEVVLNTAIVNKNIQITTHTNGEVLYTVDALSLFGDEVGRYIIEILAVDPLKNQLPPLTKININGNRLTGISGFEINDLGEIIISFVGKESEKFLVRIEKDNQLTYKTFVLEQKDGHFITTLKSIKDLFDGSVDFDDGEINVQLAVVEEESLPSPFSNLQFDYITQSGEMFLKRGRNESENFIVIFDEAYQTTAFDVKLKYKKFVDNTLLSQEKSYQFLSNETLGYWISNHNQEYFSKTLNEGENGRPCFALDLSQLLKDIDYGKIEIEVSRIAKNNNSYILYCEQSFNLKKLNTPDNLTFASTQKAVLTWDWKIKNENDNISNLEDLELYSGFIIYITETEGDGKRLFKVNSLTRDIFDDLIPGVEYKIFVKAVSNNPQVIASNNSEHLIRKKLSQSKEVKLVNGQLVFDADMLNELDFIKYYQDNYFQPNLIQNYAKEEFKDLFTFTPGNFASQKIRLTFTNVTNNANYSSVVEARNLMPDLSEVKIVINSVQVGFLESLQEVLANGSPTDLAYKQMRDFVEAIKSSSHGIANETILFDDFGNQIPSGQYKIVTSHYSDPRYANIESNNSQEKNFSLTPNVSYRLYQDNESEDYMIKFALAQGYFGVKEELSVATSYTMVLRKTNESIYKFTFSSEPLRFVMNDGENSITLDNVLSWYNKDENYLSINLSQLAKNATDGLFVKDNYTIEIFANGNDYAINGKSAKFTANFLDFNDKFKFENGHLSWSVPDNLTIRVATKIDGFEEEIEEINSENKFLELKNNGEYQYVILSLKGSVDTVNNRVVNIESERYGIINPVKLVNPNISAKNCSLQIQEAIENRGLLAEKQYRISNNNTNNENSEYKYFSTDSTTENLYIYHPGQLGNLDNKYKESERGATEFYVSQYGNNGTIQTEKVDSENYRFQLKLDNNDKFIFASDLSSLKGKMLDASVHSISIENGDIKWEDTANEILEDGNKLVYKVIVNITTQSTGVINTQELYTVNTELDTSFIKKTTEEDIYSFLIQRMSFGSGTEEDYDFVTVEGIYLKANDSKYFDASYVFASEYVEAGKNITRTSKVEELQIDYDSLIWKDSNLSCEYIVLAKDNQGHITNLLGEITNIIKYNERYISFKPNNNQFIGENPYTILVYAYSKDKIKSIGTILNNVYKLKEVVQDDFEISFVRDNEYVINLSKYFQNNLIYNDNSIYNIKLNINLNEDEEEIYFTAESFAKNIIVSQKLESASFNFMVEQNEKNTFNLITSDETQFSLESVSIGDDNITWDENNQYFSWNSPNDNKEYQYLVKTVYSDEKIVEEIIFNENYYPSRIGTIKQLQVRARANSHSLFSDPIELNGNFEYNLFAFGDGSEGNPYLITEQEHFENISKRGESELYFALGNNLMLENISLKSFSSHLDGRGYTISYRGNRFYECDYTETLPSTSNVQPKVKFESYTSLIEQVTEQGIIENLNLEFSVTEQIANNCLLAPLVFKNHGLISNIKILNINIEYNAINDNSLALAGIVGVNYGVVDNCENLINQRISSINCYNFIYGGITLSNARNNGVSGVIKNSLNSGHIEIVARKQNSSYYIVGFAINNYGNIEQCGNNGELKVVGSVKGCTSFVSGITLTNNGTIKNTFNNANVSCEVGTKYLSGIIYQLVGGKVDGLVDTTMCSIVAVSKNNPYVGSCYRLSNSALTPISTLNLTENLILDCGGGKRMTVTTENDRLVARFEE